MGGFFGATSKRDVVLDVFFGVDYHSHLGTRRGGMAAVNEEKSFLLNSSGICQDYACVLFQIYHF